MGAPFADSQIHPCLTQEGNIHMRQRTTAATAATATRDSAFGPIARTSAALGLAVSLGAGGMLLGTTSALAAEDDTTKTDPIGTWTPAATKGVLGSSVDGQKGPHQNASINGLGILAGQSVKYEIQADLTGDAELADKSTMEIRDQLPEGLSADIDNLSIYDLRVGEKLDEDGKSAVVPEADYTVTEKDGVLIIAFDAKWVEANVGGDGGRLAIVFDATSDDDVADHTSLENTAEQVFINPSSEGNEASPEEHIYPTEVATVSVAGASPTETLTYAGSDIGDKTVVGGDVLDAAVTLDGTFGEEGPLDLAYNLSRFGIVDDYDEKSVSVVKGSVKVTATGAPDAAKALATDAPGDGPDEEAPTSPVAGEDVTGLFDVVDKGGVLTVQAATGENGVVAPALLGQDYTVTYQVAVKDVKENGDIGGETVQVLGDTETPVAEEATAAVTALAPGKSAVAESGSTDALDEVAAQSEAWYRLTSSTVPANKLTDVSDWSLRDVFTSGDRALHDAWAVHADTDLLDAEGNVLFAKGDVIDDQDGGTYFAVVYDGDSVSIRATDAFLELVNSEANAGNDRAWSVYTAATRTAEEGTRVSNTGHESLNAFNRSASVTTTTGAAAKGEKPGEDPEKPGEDPEKPGEDPEAPGENPEKPGEDPEKPGEDPKGSDDADGDDQADKDGNSDDKEKKQKDEEQADKNAEERGDKQEDGAVTASDDSNGPTKLARTGADDGLMLAGAGGGLLMAAGSAAIGLSRRGKGLLPFS